MTRRPSHQHRRGFTLLETVLAMAVGSMVLASTFGVLGAIRRTERALALQTRDMNDLARTQLAVREALEGMRAAPAGAVRSVLRGVATEEEIDALLQDPNPDPIEGLGSRFELTTGVNPRLELVLSRPLLDAVRLTDGTPTPDDGAIGILTADRLPGHRGAFELRAEDGAPGPTLWWVPLPPRDLPEGLAFDESTLPPVRRLCRGVTQLKWTAFIESQRVPLVRSVESSQLPAFIELEIRTAGGAYGNWTFELGWNVGAEFEVPPELVDALDDSASGGDDARPTGEQPDPYEGQLDRTLDETNTPLDTGGA